MSANSLVAGIKIKEIIAAYEDKKSKIPAALDALKQEQTRLASLCNTMGAYGGQLFRHNEISGINPDHLITCLRKSSWRFVYDKLRIPHIAPQTHLKKFEEILENPPEFEEANIRGVFKEYVLNARQMALQAFAEVFCSLDRYYRSHDNMRVGKKGLPKRIILTGCGGYSSWGWDKAADVLNALSRYRGRPDLCVSSWDIQKSVRDGNKFHLGLEFRLFGNGNCHVYFDDDSLRDINLALAEYYGEVLPDAYVHTDKKSDSTDICKDLQYYPTPEAVTTAILRNASLQDGDEILEPSCGAGGVMDVIAKSVRADYRGISPRVSMIGVEVHPGRCAEARAKGYAVVNANFLEWQTQKRFTMVIMNPPFYGKHYAKHVRKAFDLLKPGGALYAVLPVTARDNHGLLDDLKPKWQDLPVGSFRESGTCVNTVIMTCFKPKA